MDVFRLVLFCLLSLFFIRELIQHGKTPKGPGSLSKIRLSLAVIGLVCSLFVILATLLGKGM